MVAVSVLMSVHDGERYLGEAIASVLAQSLRDFELLIIDDGSTDQTASILAAARDADARVRILANERNLGLVASLNRGLAETRAPWIARMDADDRCHPRRLERQVDFLRRHPEVDVVGSRLRVMNRWRAWQPPEAHDDIVARLLFESPLYHPTVMIRRDRDGGGLGERVFYDETRVHAEDYDLWVRLALDHGARFANLPEVLLDYRMHGSSVSRRHDAAQQRTASEIRRAQLRRLGIEASAAEMDLHDRLAVGWALPPGTRSRCKDWLERLARANDSAGVYPRAAFADWLDVLRRRMGWRGRLTSRLRWR